MIAVTRLNSSPIIINALLIETIEETPDTLLTLTTGKKITVREKADEVVALIQNYLKVTGIIRVSLQQSEMEGS